jgi:hypothetical protein
MSDGASFEWDINKNIKKLIYNDCGRISQITHFHLNAPAYLNKQYCDESYEINISFPIETNKPGIFSKKVIVSELTFAKLINYIYEFYHRIVTIDDINLAKNIIEQTEYNDDNNIIEIYKNQLNSNIINSLTWSRLILNTHNIDTIEFNGLKYIYNNKYDIQII